MVSDVMVLDAPVTVIHRPRKDQRETFRSSVPPAKQVASVGQRRGFSNRLLLLVGSPLVDVLTGQVLEAVSSRQELHELHAALSHYNIAFELGVQFAIPGRPISHAKTGSPLFIHIAAHGRQDDSTCVIAAESTVGERVWLQHQQLADFLKPLGSPPCTLAVLNVCHSEPLARSLLSLGVKHVVAVDADEAILARAGQIFSRAFYHHILARNEIDSAFEAARRAVLTSPEIPLSRDRHDGYLMLRLYPENRRHSEVIAMDTTPGTPQFPDWIRTNLGEISAYPFVGRQRDLHILNQSTLTPASPRIVVITGMGGMGKTALAEALGRWQHARSCWSDGVYIIEVRNIRSAADIRTRLAALLDLEPSCAGSNADLARRLRSWHGLLIFDDLDGVCSEDPDGLKSFLVTLATVAPRLHMVLTLRNVWELPDTAQQFRYNIEQLAPEAQLQVFQNQLSKPLVSRDLQADLHELLGMLDGYPLALKLAASHMEAAEIDLGELIRRLKQEYLETVRDLYEDENKDNSLRVSLAASYKYMPPQARDLYPVLACFPAGLTEETAKGAFDTTAIRTLETMRGYSMIELLRSLPTGGGRRFRLPEPARRFALSLLTQELKEKHGINVLSTLATLASEHSNALRSTDEERDIADKDLLRMNSRIDLEDAQSRKRNAERRYNWERDYFWSELPNFDFWLEWSLDQQDQNVLQSACRLLKAMSYVCVKETANGQSKMLRYADQFLQRAAVMKMPGCTGVLHEAMGDVHLLLKDKKNAKSMYERSLEAYQQASLSDATARAHVNIASITGDADAISHLLEARKIFDSLSDKRSSARCSEELSICHLRTPSKQTGPRKQRGNRKSEVELKRALQDYGIPYLVIAALRRHARDAADNGFLTQARSSMERAVERTVDESSSVGLMTDLEVLRKLYKEVGAGKSSRKVLNKVEVMAKTSDREDLVRFVEEIL